MKCGGIDPSVAKSRVASVLSTLSLYPTGLSPDSVLFIRKLGESMRGLHHLDVVHAIQQSEWEKAVVAIIDQMAHHARRPIHDSVRPDDEAVLFADRAELLACLAMDWIEGNLLSRWWWQGLLHNNDDSSAAVSAWLDAPEFVPAALHLLALRGKAVPFLRSLSESNVRGLLQHLLTTFGLDELKARLGRRSIGDASEDDSLIVSTPLEKTISRSPDGAESRADAPWQAWVEKVHELDDNSQVLLALGLMVHRAPQVVRLKFFARDVDAWLRSTNARDSSIGISAQSSTKSHPEAFLPPQKGPLDTDAGMAEEGFSTGEASVETEGGLTGSPQEVRADNQSQLIPSDLSSLREGALKKEPTDWAGEGDAKVADSSAGSLTAGRSTVPDDNGVFKAEDLHAETVEQTTIRRDSEEMVGLLGYEIGSRFGGVFYLINLGLLLGLYGDFTSPTRPGISLSIWDFLALIGHSLAGGKILKDPIWPLLAELAGRQIDDPPGRGFRPSSSWRMPPHWLDAFPEQATCRWTADGRRLRVRHPAGFLIVDVPVRKADILQQLEEELAQYRVLRKIRVRRGRVKEIPERKSGVSRWMAWFAPYAHARLLRGLGETRRRELRRLVCMHRARIVVTPTRIDVEFELNKLPIQVRLGGLDRDPGWVPAAGRFVSFQYK